MENKIYQCPCHINIESDCCGIFNKIVDNNLVCNECEEIFYSIENLLPGINEQVWVWDNEQPNCIPIKDERINSPELEWAKSYGVTHWKPIEE